jgi:hypothetical protein
MLNNEHPARILRYIGVSELPASVAVAAIAVLQYLFLIRLWQGYALKWMGDMISPNVVESGIAVSVGGALAIAWLSIRQTRSGTDAAKRLERPADNSSFDRIRSSLSRVAARSTLPKLPRLMYTPKNALALEAREFSGTDQSVVVGLMQRSEELQKPLSFAAMIGHEVSHLELSQTRGEVHARRVISVHFRILGWLALVFLLTIAFIDRSGLGSAPPFAGFVPIFDLTIYSALSAQFAILLLSSGVVFIYSYYFLVRREHIHDFRGSQLAGTDALAKYVFKSPGSFRERLQELADFFALHPGRRARRRVVLYRDFVLLSAITYPLILAQILPLGQLLTAGWQSEFSFDTSLWNLGDTLGTGLLLFMVVSADVERLGISVLLDRRNLVLVPIYAAIAGVATQIPRFVIEIIFGIRHELSITQIGVRLMTESLTGGFHVAIMVTLLLVVLAFLCAIRTAARGEAITRRGTLVHLGTKVAIAIGAFTISSLRSPQFVFDVFVLLGLVVGFNILFNLLAIRCPACNRQRGNAILLNSRCSCGHEQLEVLRRFHSEPYSTHVVGAGQECGESIS